MPRKKPAKKSEAPVSTDRRTAEQYQKQGYRLYEVTREGIPYFVMATSATSAKQSVSSFRGDHVRCLQARKPGRTGPRDPKKVARTILSKLSEEDRKELLRELSM